MSQTTGNKILASEITEEQTESGIVLPDTVTQHPNVYKVEKVGPDAQFIAEGDIVWIADQRAASGVATITIKGTKYFLLTEDQVIEWERGT